MINQNVKDTGSVPNVAGSNGILTDVAKTSAYTVVATVTMFGVIAAMDAAEKWWNKRKAKKEHTE